LFLVFLSALYGIYRGSPPHCGQSHLEGLIWGKIFGIAAELGFYFFFSLFPTLFSASFILGLVAARSADRIYDTLLHYLALALVVPTAALGTVLETFNATTAVATSGKLTFGLIAAIWSASVAHLRYSGHSQHRLQD